jgi:hypothetical protein
MQMGMLPGTGKAGPAASTGAAKTGASAARQARGSDIGRDGALSRGQGFSQRDSFTPAKQAQKPGGANQAARQGVQHQPQKQATQQDPQKQSQQSQQSRQSEQTRQSMQQENQQAGDVKRAIQSAELRMEQQALMRIALIMNDAGLAEETREMLRRMYKKFLEWLKEMDEIFRAPSPA